MKQRNAFYTQQTRVQTTTLLTSLVLLSSGSLLIQSRMNKRTNNNQNEAQPIQEGTQKQRLFKEITDENFQLGQQRQIIYVFYSSQNVLHKEFMHEVELRQTFDKIIKRYPNADIVEVDISQSNSQNTEKFINLVEYSIKRIGEKKRPTVYIQSDDRISKVHASLLNEDYNEKFNTQFQKEISFYTINSVKELAVKLGEYNKNLDDVTILYCYDPEIENDPVKLKAKQIGFRLVRNDGDNPILQVRDQELAKKMRMEPGKFYCYYKPSYINGFEQYQDRDIYFDYLQAYEGVCRDEFTIKQDYLESEEFKIQLAKYQGFYTFNFSQQVFDSCFTRTFNVEFYLDPNFRLFKHKMKTGKATKPMMFIYCPPLYMSRYIGDFKEVLKNYHEVFEIYYTDDQKKASEVFYVQEFPDVFPYVVIVDPKKKKALKKDSIQSEVKEGQQDKVQETNEELALEKNNFYFQKYREIIFFNNIKKHLNKLIDKFLDGEAMHFYQSEKMKQETRVKKICQDNFEEEIVKNPQIQQCIIEIFKHDCPSCTFNGKVFNVFSRKLEKHNYLSKLPCYRLAIDNRVPYLGNFGYSPIYFYVKKNGDKIVEIKTLDPPQKSEEFLKQIQQYSQLKGFSEKIKLQPREQILKHIKLEDLADDFDIDFDTEIKPVEAAKPPVENAQTSNSEDSKSNQNGGLINAKQGPSINTINGTGEINYNQTAQTGQIPQQVKGPQLTFDKNYLCMKANVGEIEQDKVVVTNVGSTTVTYIWKKVQRGDYIQSKSSDGVQRFYCHYVIISYHLIINKPRSILKPGESKTFIFSFRSDSKPGIFFEEWELLTEPVLLTPLPLINLTGMSIKDDTQVSTRDQYKKDALNEEKVKITNEIYEEIFQGVPIPETPPPNLRDPAVFKQHFEDNNKHLGLYYTPGLMNQLFELLQDIQNRVNPYIDYFSPWKGKIEYLEELISQVPNPYSKTMLKERYIKLLSQAKRVPTDRAQSYPVFRGMLLDLAEHAVEFEQKAREELQMIENTWGFVVPHEGQTEEEVKKIEEEKKAKKADWLKKTKKKPKTEEEEQAEMEELRSRIGNGLKHELMQSKVEKAEQQVSLVKIKWLFENHLKMDAQQYDELYRLESILDIDISGKDLILRLDLDVPLSPYTPPPPISQLQTHEDHQKSQVNTRGQKKTAQQLQQEALLHQQQLLAQQQQQEEPWRKRDILDHTLIKKASLDLRYCIEHLANRTFIIGNLGEKCGKIKPENSMKIIFNVLQQQLMEQPMVFIQDPIIKNFEQRRENEEFAESTTFMLENLNFKPDEFGYVEPDKPPEEPKPTEEELKKEEELKQQQLLAQQQKQKPGAAQGKPADKKKAEEEAKKKAEEEAAALKKKLELEKLNAISEEERLEQQRIKEEAERKKREAEYFDYKTIFNYKEQLGKYGDIYVNDAPMMTLTQSNSISEIKCKKRVMGVRMTEEIRKLCLFFLKKHPNDIQQLWYKPPPTMQYHQNKFSVILGGVFKNSSELLDKVLMVNSFIDTTQRIYFVGELGVAALYALGVKVGKVEGSGCTTKDYELAKDFFLNIFERAILAEVKLFFPTDFYVSPKYEIEDPETADQAHDETHNNTQHSNTQQQQIQQKTQQQTQGKNLNQSQQQITMGDDEITKKSGAGFGSQPAKQENNIWKPYHWADKIIANDKHKNISLSRHILEKWQIILDNIWPKYVQKNSIDTYNGYYTGRNYSSYYQNYEPIYQPEEDSEKAVSQLDLDHDYILEYGLETRQKLFQEIETSFKILWDGSLSLYANNNIFTSDFNKIFVKNLLDIRTRTSHDDEPPVTLLHGKETEQVVRQSIMRLKLEQQAAQEEAKRKAAAEGEEVDDEEVDQITMTQDESKEEASSIHQDMMQIADFLCFDIPQFTTKILQGVPIRALYNLDQHPKKTKEQEEEDLFLLDEI